MTDLTAMTDDTLGDLVRDRQVALGEALAELERRKAWHGCDAWSDDTALALIAAKRQRQEVPRRPKGTAPLMFRAGYEWAALSIFTILESVLDRVSEDAVMLSEYKPVGKGLYRFDKVAKVFDPRRRAALELIELLEGFVSIDLRAFFSLPPRRSTYHPSDDEKQKWTSKAPSTPNGTLWR